jgi:mRNA interferase MazF
MISTQLRHHVDGFDELIKKDADDFGSSGLKAESVVLVGRLAVVDEKILIGSIGEIAPARLRRIKSVLADWVLTS